MTRMPRVREVVKEFFGKDPHTGGSPDEVVAMGAAIQAGVLQGDVKAVRLLDVRASTDIADLLPQVRVPTLVLHARDDEVIPIVEGRRLASEIPGAEFVELDSRNPVLLEHEPAWQVFQRAVREFTGVARDEARPAGEAPLTKRERRILDLLRAGKTNAEIAAEVFISEKTVRNHLSSVYRKLGVSNRAQAIVRTGSVAEPGTA